MRIEVFTDGSATTKDKPGGFAWALVVDGVKHSEGSGHIPLSSNNDAELEAAIQGLTAALTFILKHRNMDSFTESTPSGITYNVTLCSDSQLILGWASGRFKFKQLDKMQKYDQLMSLVNRLYAQTLWIKGHSGHEHNDRCDKLANDARKNIPTKIIDKESIKRDTKIGKKKNGTASVWYLGSLKVIDFEQGIIESYDRDTHGKRGSIIEIRESKDR